MDQLKKMQPQTQEKLEGSLQITQSAILPGVLKPRHMVANPIALGDLYYSSGSDFNRLAIGSTGAKLTVVAGKPAWVSFPVTGLAAARPSSGLYAGYSFFATDTFALSIWTGAAYKSVTLS